MKKIFSLLFLILSVASYSQYNFRVADSVLATLNKPVSPGVSVLVRKGGKIIYNNKGGYANIATGEAISDKTIFNMASDTKQFTAACLVMLEQKGKLKFDDKLSKYFPNISYADKVTLQQLLNHTSGIKDYRVLVMLAGKNIEDMSDKDIRNYLAMSELDFEPGSEFSYSNSGYWFLVQVIEKVSKMPIDKFAEKQLFQPLKMKDTRYMRDTKTLKNAALGYKFEDGKYIACPTDNGVFGGSGMVSTANDLSKWLDEMDTKKVFGTVFWNAMFNGEQFKQAKDLFYSNGLQFGVYGKSKRIYHGGDLEGFHSVMSYFPGDSINVIVLTNNGDFKVNRLQASIINRFFGYTHVWPAPAKPSPEVADEILEKYVGAYEKDQLVFDITIGSHTIHARQVWDNLAYDIPAVDEANFFVPEIDAAFVFESFVNNKAQVMKLTQEGETAVFKRIEKYDSPDLSKYSGRFRCKSLETEYSIILKDGNLFYSINGRDIQASGSIEDDIVTTDIGKLTFHSNTDGTITGFTLNHPRAKNLEFVKV